MWKERCGGERGFTNKHPLLPNLHLTLTHTHTPTLLQTLSSSPAFLWQNPHYRHVWQLSLSPSPSLQSFSIIFICSFSLALLIAFEPAWQSKGEKTQMRAEGWGGGWARMLTGISVWVRMGEGEVGREGRRLWGEKRRAREGWIRLFFLLFLSLLSDCILWLEYRWGDRKTANNWAWQTDKRFEEEMICVPIYDHVSRYEREVCGLIAWCEI